MAVFGSTDGTALFSMRCERVSGTVLLARAGTLAGPTTMTIKTETQDRKLTARPNPGTPPMIETSLVARDGLLDAMALSKGRFAVEVSGLPSLYLPSWAEVTRVIEDCR